MGQITSRLLEDPTRPTGPFPLENVPVDVLLMIADYLDPVTYMSLAITCKSFHHFLHKRGKLDNKDRQVFIQKLERNLGDKKWYCHFCTKLHPFRPTWTPMGREMWPDALRKENGVVCFRTPCRYERLGGVGMTFQRNSCGGSTNYYNLGWHHARLVMNRHLFGAPHGLPLSNLRRRFADPDNRTTPSFIQDWSAKIVHDELLLQGVHIWFARDPPPDRDGRRWGARPFHRPMYYLCPHTVAAFTDPGLHDDLADVRELRGCRTLEYKPCRNVLESCGKCLTDYVVTIKRIAPPKKKRTGSEATAMDHLRRAGVRQIRRALGLGKNKNNAESCHVDGSGDAEKPLEETRAPLAQPTTNQADDEPQESGWLVTIKTYHQFGKCRSPLDPKWMALTMDPRHLTRISFRFELPYPKGCVKRKWNHLKFTDYWNKVNKITKPRNGVLEV